jgi:CRP/FNR family transcriptional regulator, cyclic AMP receptor protein
MVPHETLGQLGFLEGFPPEYLKPLAAMARLMTVPPNEVVFHEGQKSPDIFLVVEGRVALELSTATRGATRIQVVGPGRLLGWTPLLGQGTMTATARTLDACRLVALNAMQVLQVCAQNPQLGLEFMRRTILALSRRLNGTRLRLLEAYEDELPVISE